MQITMSKRAALLAILGAIGATAAPVAGAAGVVTAESVPATMPTTTITTTTTRPSATASGSYVSAAPAVTVVAEMKCTEANLLKCTINEWRDAEVCFVELCLQ